MAFVSGRCPRDNELRMLHNPCRFSDVCRLYLKESSTCNSDSEAVGYCGVFRTYAEN